MTIIHPCTGYVVEIIIMILTKLLNQYMKSFHCWIILNNWHVLEVSMRITIMNVNIKRKINTFKELASNIRTYVLVRKKLFFHLMFHTKRWTQIPRKPHMAKNSTIPLTAHCQYFFVYLLAFRYIRFLVLVINLSLNKHSNTSHCFHFNIMTTSL